MHVGSVQGVFGLTTIVYVRSEAHAVLHCMYPAIRLHVIIAYRSTFTSIVQHLQCYPSRRYYVFRKDSSYPLAFTPSRCKGPKVYSTTTCRYTALYNCQMQPICRFLERKRRDHTVGSLKYEGVLQLRLVQEKSYPCRDARTLILKHQVHSPGDTVVRLMVVNRFEGLLLPCWHYLEQGIPQYTLMTHNILGN